MENIFPFIDPEEIIESEMDNEIPIAREWAWNFEKKDFKTRNGKMYHVEGNEAIKIWLWKLFNSPRFRYLIYNWDYGHELEELIGQGFTEGYLTSEAERYVKEAIEYNLSGYVIDLEDIEVTFKDTTLTIKFTAITPYGEVDIIV